MKNSKKNINFMLISAIASVIVVLLHIDSQYPNGLGIQRAAFDYVWFSVYVYTSSTFLVAATLILILSCKKIHDLYHSGMIKNMIQRETFLNIYKKA